jgi:hypothetical protein
MGLGRFGAVWLGLGAARLQWGYAGPLATKKAASGDGGLREKLVKRSSSPPRVTRAAAAEECGCRYGHGFVYASGVADCQRNPDARAVHAVWTIA